VKYSEQQAGGGDAFYKGDKMQSREEIEKAVIGSILLDGADVMPEAVNEGLAEDWFIHPVMKKIFKEALHMFAEAKPIDSCSIGLKLKDDERISLLDAIDSTITSAHAKHYMELLNTHRQHAMALQVADTSKRALERVHPLESLSVIDTLKGQWSSIGGETYKCKSLGAMAVEQVNEWELPKEKKPQKVVWPLEWMNTAIGTMGEELVYVVAKESVGKTAFCIQLLMANHNAGMAGYMASLESSAPRLVPRMIGHIAHVNTLTIDRGFYTPEIIERCRKAAAFLETALFKIVDRPMTIEQLHAWAKISVQQGAKFLIIDNTRSIRITQNFGNNAVLEMRHISSRITQIRNDVRVPIIVIHHAADTKEGEKMDVSWSKDIKRDTDILLFMENNAEEHIAPTQENKYVGRWVVNFEVRKNRDGRTGMIVPVEFYKEHQRFLEAE
jgi:replicative DNA helicase